MALVCLVVAAGTGKTALATSFHSDRLDFLSSFVIFVYTTEIIPLSPFSANRRTRFGYADRDAKQFGRVVFQELPGRFG